jgi:MoaD family protein
MKVNVQYYGSIRAVADKKEEEVEILRSATVYELLLALSGRYGEPFDSEIFEGGEKQLRDDLMIAINGALIERTGIIGTALNPGDAVTLLPIFLGGG